jgi:nucleotide-binding universal stress UspA family protein
MRKAFVEIAKALVVGVSGSRSSWFALAEAVSLAKETRQVVVVVFVRTMKWAPANEFSTLDVSLFTDALNFEEVVIEGQCITILDPAGVKWRYVVRSGDPAKELIKIAHECGASTIVVGGSRSNPLMQFVRVPLASRLFNRWPQSLLVARPPEHTHWSRSWSRRARAFASKCLAGSTP